MSERDNMNLTPEERQLQQSVRDLGEVRANDAFREKLRQQFISGEIAAGEDSSEAGIDAPAKIVEMPLETEPNNLEPKKRRSRKRMWAIVPAMAAMLAIVIFSDNDPQWTMEDVRGSGVVTVNGETVDVSDRAAVAKLITPTAHIAVPEGVELDVVLGRVLVLGVAGPAEFTLPGNPSHDDYAYETIVHQGEFRIKTGPGFPGSDMLILTTEGRVEITGTTIAVFKNDDVTCVCVLEGTAQIGKDGDHMDAVGAGMRKVMFVDARDPMIAPIEPGHKESLIEFEDHNQETFDN